MNSVDNCAKSAQYLAVADFRIRYFVGDLLLGPDNLQGKIVHGGNFMPAKKKAAKKKKH